MKFLAIGIFSIFLSSLAYAEQTLNINNKVICGHFDGYRSSWTDLPCPEAGFACVILSKKRYAFGEGNHSRKVLESLYFAAEKAEELSAMDKEAVTCLKLNEDGHLKSAETTLVWAL